MGHKYKIPINKIELTFSFSKATSRVEILIEIKLQLDIFSSTKNFPP